MGGREGGRREKRQMRGLATKRRQACRLPGGERLERRDVMASFSYSSAFLEAIMTDLTTGDSEVIRLGGAVADQVSGSVAPLALEESSQTLEQLSLAGVEPNRFGTLSMALDPSVASVGRIVEQVNSTPGVLEFPATSQLDLAFVLEMTRFDTPIPQTVSLAPTAAVRIEAGVSELAAGPNDTFYARPRTIYLTDTPGGSPLYSLTNFAFSFAPEFAQVSGQKFEDVNGNGKRDPGEVGLNGWSMALVEQALVDQAGGVPRVVDVQTTHDIDWNQDQTIDPETERGWYVFADVPPARYMVTEHARAGWQSTAPLEQQLSSFPVSAPGSRWVDQIVPEAGAGQAAVVLSIDWPEDGNLDGQVDERVVVGANGGIVRWGWGAPTPSSENSMFSELPAEIGGFELSGGSSRGPVTFAGGDGGVDFTSSGAASLGKITQRSDDDTLANAQFQLDFTLDVGAPGSLARERLTPAAALTIQAVVDRLSLEGFVLTSQTPVALVNDQAETRARIVGLDWVFYRDEQMVGAVGYELPMALGRNYRTADFGNRDRQSSDYGFDFGDARFSEGTPGYPTTLAQDGARHVVNGRLFLGASVDVEEDAAPSTDALGDDVIAGDDEDGVVLHGAAVIGQDATFTVTASRSGVLDAWIDWNRDGDWEDDAEQVFVGQSLVAGGNELTISIPADAVAGATFSRYRLSSAGGLSFAGAAPDGEVEDHLIVLHATQPPTRDFGDANNDLPDSFPTRESEGGAWHSLTTGHYLGNFVDGELDGTSTLRANGDDDAGLSDEDGVTVLRPMEIGGTGMIEVRASLAGFLNAWIDFNQDGDWNDAGEQVFDAMPLDAGANRLTVPVPSAIEGARPSLRTAARFRFTADEGEGRAPGDGASTGEVEDYVLEVTHPVLNVSAGDWNLALGTASTPRGGVVPGVFGLSNSPLISDAVIDRFSQLADQAFFYRLAGDSGESSLDNLQFMSAQVDYAGSQVVFRYGDPAKFDPLEVTVIYTLSSFDSKSVTLDEVIIITNLSPDPIQLSWFAFTDANLNGAFGYQDTTVADAADSFRQSNALGGSFLLTIPSAPLPDSYQLGDASGLWASLTDTDPTALGNTPALGVTTAAGDVAQALQWDLSLGNTDDDRTTVLNLVKAWEVVPVVTPTGRVLNGGSGLAGAGGVATSGFLGGGGFISEPGGRGLGEVGAPSSAACRGLCILDPAIAVGFDFASETGNGFAEVTLPVGIGDDDYLLQWPDGVGGWNETSLQGGVTHSFLTDFPTGADHFRVLGIETGAGIDPLDPLGFPTLIRFVSPTADWKTRMTAIPDRVYVDPTGAWREEINVGEFGRTELGDIVTYRPGTPDEVGGLRFGEAAFSSRAAAQAYLESLGALDLTEIVEVATDWGDAPSPYPTLFSDNGPLHPVGSLLLGLAIDGEGDGQPTANADGDDTNGVLDEEGIAMLNAWQQGGTAQLRIRSSGSGLVNAWVDWNDDGDWSDAGEQVLVDRAVTAGDTNVSFSVPLDAVVGATTYSRFRLSSQGGLSPTGMAPDGEVEDYVVPVTAAVSRAETSYAASQGQLVLRMPGGEEITIPLVGASVTQLLTSDSGAAFDSDGDLKDEVAQELKSLVMRSWTTLGRVDVSLVASPRSLGKLEEVVNQTSGVLDIIPFAAMGTADSTYDVYFQITVTNGATVNVYRNPTPARLAANVSGDPTSLGEALTGANGIPLVDGVGASSGIVLVSQSYTPNPLRPWHNIVNRLDIDNSGEVVPLDALLVINELNNPVYSTNNLLPAPVNPALPPPPYVDVTASGSVEPLDALLVINFLNGVEGEGETGEASPSLVEANDGSSPEVVAFAVATMAESTPDEPGSDPRAEEAPVEFDATSEVEKTVDVELEEVAGDGGSEDGEWLASSSSSNDPEFRTFSSQSSVNRRSGSERVEMTSAERRARWQAWVAYWAAQGGDRLELPLNSRFRASESSSNATRLASWSALSDADLDVLARARTIDPAGDAT